MEIKKLFDSSKDIYRPIDKVITYAASQESRLKAEISEYVVTETMEEQFEELLTKMQLAMDSGQQNEIGVWVSGFYGSGKSSFTKYLGLALDERVTIEGVPFLKYLQDRMNKPQTRARLATVAKRFPAAVVLLDLASEMLAGATMEEVSSVLFYKVLQWAGYSRNLKVAALERRLRKDGRYDAFCQRVQEELGLPWEEVHDDPLVVDSLVPELAHEFYPNLFKTPTAFNTGTGEFKVFVNQRVQEMLDIVRKTTGKEYVIFIIDEVGQYVASRPNLILNLDGLAKNIKEIGGGKAWLIATAQQTLTEDDPRAALNSPALYKLEARFPIKIDLASRDIKEICYRRLLAKSPDGANRLRALFDQHGQALRFNTKLQDARFYDANFDKETFVNLYPFLPAHFDILLHLLGALAKSTGGIGLRSAIKVIQDILIEENNGQPAVADRPVGWLATTITLYDALEKDIQRAAPSIHQAVGKALIRFSDSPIHQEVAKTVAVLQILGNVPVTSHNIASLTHPAVDSPSRAEEIAQAIEDLKNDGMVPFGEKDGNLCFFSEKINDIDRERAELPLRSVEARRIFNEALKEVYSPLPATRLHNTLTVTSGLKVASGGQIVPLSGERETIQTVVELVSPEDYETARNRLLDESRQRSSQHTIFLLARRDARIDDLVADIYRCQEIVNRHRNDPDQEVKEYCRGQEDRAAALRSELERLLKNQLSQGSFIFRGQATAVDSLGADLLEAAKKHLAGVAEQVFERYDEAPVRAETGLAEKFLRLGNLKAITTDTDPLNLVKLVGGNPQIDTSHKALVSLKDYLDRSGLVDGKRLTDHFTAAPFGWSPDTLRYLVAALLVAGEVKLKVSGREITVNGQQAIETLRTNNAFKSVGVALRDEKLEPAVLARAAQRLTELTGESVIPLEQEISKAAMKHFPHLQQRYGSLAEKLRQLKLPGDEEMRRLTQDLADVLETDASDLPQRLGSEESTLYERLKWAAEASQALEKGLEDTIVALKAHVQAIQELPNAGEPATLKQEVDETLRQIAERMGEEDFYRHTADLNSALTGIQAAVSQTVQSMATRQIEFIQAEQHTLRAMYEWAELTQEEQSQILGQLEALLITPSENLDGLKALVAQQFTLQKTGADLQAQVEELGQKRRMERLQTEKERATKEGRSRLTRTLTFPARLTTPDALDSLIRQLQAIKKDLELYSEIEVTIQIED